jgi:hypothetical protein
MEGARMEPDLATDASLLAVLAELRQREPIFHRREHLSSREDFERQTAADFWEVGSAHQEATMTKVNVNNAQCAALFASGLQRSDAPARGACPLAFAARRAA